ncbi:uncharacterized protein LOC131801713 [Musca domestica]|uniref:Uncharacterized protein LOC131801713 n=1 Tax=Musca domestica TaxID=7370 RepID=A0ABM3USX0_MUSDO|nr:uncharacterized protein LOC131801713 [Musca domestica]
MDGTNQHPDKFKVWCKWIGHYHTLLYGICLSYNLRQSIFHTKCAFPIPYYCCYGIILVLLVMVLASAAIPDGIKTGNSKELLPWIILTPLMTLICVVIYFLVKTPTKIGMVILIVSNIVAWYPIFKLYRQIKAEKDAKETAEFHIGNTIIHYSGTIMDLHAAEEAAAASEERHLSHSGHKHVSYNTMDSVHHQGHGQVFSGSKHLTPTMIHTAALATYPVTESEIHTTTSFYSSVANENDTVGLRDGTTENSSTSRNAGHDVYKVKKISKIERDLKESEKKEPKDN